MIYHFLNRKGLWGITLYQKSCKIKFLYSPLNPSVQVFTQRDSVNVVSSMPHQNSATELRSQLKFPLKVSFPYIYLSLYVLHRCQRVMYRSQISPFTLQLLGIKLCWQGWWQAPLPIESPLQRVQPSAGQKDWE